MKMRTNIQPYILLISKTFLLLHRSIVANQDVYLLKSFRFYAGGLHYYTLQRDGASFTLVDAFFNRLSERFDSESPERQEQISNFIAMLDEMGKRGPNLLDDGALRDEKKAHALPPETFYLRKFPHLSAFRSNARGLRLYAYPASDKILVLFSGDFKTAKSAQACPNVKPHFDFAQKAAQALLDVNAAKEWQFMGNIILVNDAPISDDNSLEIWL